MGPVQGGFLDSCGTPIPKQKGSIALLSSHPMPQVYFMLVIFVMVSFHGFALVACCYHPIGGV